MKKTLKILSWICTVVLILGTVSVGMSAYAASDNVIGDYDFTITNVYKDIDWNNVTAYKAETHVHTVRSDADEEINRMIRNYYSLGYDAMCLTDHGTVNYGWTNDQSRLAIFEYQYFVHGETDELSEDEYRQIITGTKARSINSGKGMMEIPLGIELNGMSTVKCHVNGFYVDAGHGDLGITEDWPTNAVKTNYNAGGFSHINHVGEWSEGNDDASVYSQSWINDFAAIYEAYCPNRGGRNVAAQTSWMSSHKGEAGCIGMELVNTADSRTHNDRRFVYDEILKKLAPQGINVFGFCEDDAHEPSDCDRNAQYFLINNTKKNDVEVTASEYGGINCQAIKASQEAYRQAMFYGEFYASSKNSKNAYELGNGFSASGEYPAIKNISVDNDKDQISVTYTNATKIRMVADGEIIETNRTDAGENTVVFDLNRYESKINSYVRIYLTGNGGITYIQPFLVSKTLSKQSTVQFITPAKDVNVEVKDSNGSVVPDAWKYENNYYILPAGDYTYTASRRGYMPTKGSFSVTAEEIAAGEQKKINVELEEMSDVSYAYFYTPETIYLSPNDNISFEKYIDRENAINGALHTDARSQGNIFFSREGASNLVLTYETVEGNALINTINIGSTTASGASLATSITSGSLASALNGNDDYVLIKWIMNYDYRGAHYVTYSYSYVYKVPVNSTSVIGAGGFAKTKKNVTSWAHTTMYVAASIYVSGVNEIEHTDNDANKGYTYAPYSGINFIKDNHDMTVTGTGFKYKSDDSSGGSCNIVVNNTDTAYVYADRSRIDNWSQIPYLKIGFDLNDVDEVDGDEYSGTACARLLFDTPLTQTSGGTYSPDKILYDLKYADDDSTYTVKTDYNLTDGSGNYATSTTGSKGGSLAGFDSQRLYMSDNDVAAKTLNYALPSASTPESAVPVSAFVNGGKSSRNDSVGLEVTLTLVNVDKSALRTEFNNSIKDGFQKEWFATVADWDAYQAAVINAGKVLGDPKSTSAEIETVYEDLQSATDNANFKAGTMTVNHYWKLANGETGLIYTGTTNTYKLGSDLSANAEDIIGYEYANWFECYDGDGNLIDSGEAAFDLAFAELEAYVWNFYYTPNAYNVIYNSVGAGEITDYDAVAYFGQPYTVSSVTPQKPGYTFNGWYLDNTMKNYSAGEEFEWKYAGDGEFTARWVANSYNVTYYAEEGSTTPITVDDRYMTVNYDDTYSICPDVPLKPGYSFMGWQLNGGNTYTAGSQVDWKIAADSSFVAQWKIAEHEVTFDKVADDATLNMDSKIVTYDEPYGTLAEATREGYTAEWYSDPSYASINKVTATTTVKIDADHTLYAKWTPVQYKITYNLDGGTVAGINPTTYTVADDDIVLKQPTRAGYTFVGWEGSDISVAEPNHTIAAGSTGDKTFNAIWSADGYKITYTLNGGENDAKNPSSFGVTDTVTIYPATKTGYTFLGWTGSNGTSPETIVTIAAGSTSDKAYTANWQIENYSITYNLVGGTVAGTNPGEYNVETADFTLINPTKDGYDFAGWTCSNPDFEGSSITVEQGSSTGDLVFTAAWAEKGAHTVTYVLNGGKVEGTNPSSYKYGESFTLINPAKDGYTFAGWTKEINGVSAAPATTAGVIASDDSDVKFTANWNVIDYTIQYNLAGGRIASAATNPTTYNAESGAITLVNPVKPGYTFAGWTGTEITSPFSTVIIPAGSIGNRNYTASWVKNSYTINYNLNGGTDAGFVKKYDAETTASIGAPVRPGYTFAGWNIEFTNFTWLEGTIDSNGKLGSATGSYYSDAIVLRSGSTYMLNSSVSGLKVYAFDKDGAFLGEMSSTFTPSQDSVIYLVANGVSSADSLRSVKIAVSGTKDSYAITAATASTLGSAGNMNMTANWTGEEYTITYAGCDDVSWGEGVTANPNPTTYTYDSSDILLENPSKSGFTFEGWNYNGSLSKSAVIKRGSTGDRTYTAVFAIQNFTLTYKGIEGATVNNPATYTVNSETITLNNPIKEGYTFEGWVGTGIAEASKSVSIESGSTGNREYLATWTPVTYSITYRGVEGATVNNPNSYTIETPTFTLNNPAKNGAVFAGWQVEGTDGTQSTVTVAKGSTGEKTFTATWTYTDYNITYDLAGGTETTNPTTYRVTSADISLMAPTKTGYTFTGWTGTGVESLSTGVIIKSGSIGHRDYTAHWQPITYTITYDLAGGQVADNANPATYTIESPTINLVKPVKVGSIFAGWVGTGLDAATTDVSIARGSTGSRRYTATWEDDNYTITYEGIEGATFDGENRSFYTAATNTFTLINPTKRGYHFDGWSGTGISGSGRSDNVTITKGSTGDRKYTANWSLENYTVTYELNGGTETIKNPTQYNINSAPFTLYAPVRAGYEFDGWMSDYFSDVSTDITIDPSTMATDISFSAQWSVGNYTITLDPNGGTLPSGQAATINYTSESATITIQNPTRDGYTFAGWTGAGISGTTDTLEIPTGSTGNKSYKALWISGENELTYNLNGGVIDGGENPTSYVTDTGEFVLVNPVKEGYQFSGWTVTRQTQSGIVTLLNNGKLAMVDTAYGGSAVLSANWTPLSYKITYNLNGGSASSNPKTYTVESTFTLNNPVRTGYTFAGWTGTDLDSSKSNTNVSVSNKTGNRTYTATWNEEAYAITYDYNGGSTSESNPATYTVITPSFTLHNPEKAGYTFLGWTGDNGTTPQKTVTISSGSTGAKSYVANFELESYTITFYNADMPAQTYTAESADFSIPNPTKAGYEFLGWKHVNAVNPEKDIVIAHGSSGDKEFTAQWKEIEYNITYVLNGGVVSGTNPDKYTIESAKITLSNPTKEGYTFIGWDTSDGAENQMLVEIEKGSTGDKTFTAKWGTAPYKISYTGISADTIEVLNLPTTYTAEESKAIGNPEKAGYVFEGWTGTGLTTPTKGLVIPVGSTGNRSYKAVWSLVEYTINYDLAGGTEVSENPTTFTVDSEDIRLIAPRKDNMSFLGWTGSNGTVPQKEVVISRGTATNLSYTANWTERTNNLHRIYFKGYDNAKLYVRFEEVNGVPVAYDYIEVEIGHEVTSADNEYIFDYSKINTTAGYKVTGWDIDFNESKYRNSEEDVIVHAKWVYGDDNFSVIVNGTEPYTKSCSQFEKVTATTAFNKGDSVFRYWIISDGEGAGEIVSYYRNYSFYAHADLAITAVYGSPAPDSEVRAATRISRIEGYDPNYDWFTPYSERSIGTELTLLKHGIIFTDDASVGGNVSSFVVTNSAVKVGVAGTKSLTGSWALSIPNPYKYGETIYVRSYIVVIDADKVQHTIYSSIKTYTNNEDTTPNAKTPN